MKVERPKIIRLELNENEIGTLRNAKEILGNISKEMQGNMMGHLRAKYYEDDFVVNNFDIRRIIDALKYLIENDLTLEMKFPYCHCGAKMKEANHHKECHKPASSYYRGYCAERQEDAYCEGCEFWF